MRQLVIALGLVVLTTACTSPWARKKRPVAQSPRVVYQAPRVVYQAAPPVVVPGTYKGPATYHANPKAGGGTSNPSYGANTTSPTGPGAYSPAGSAFEKNPVPGSVREYINRYGSSGTMSK